VFKPIMNVTTLALQVALWTWTSYAVAQMPPPAQAPVPSVTAILGQPITIDFHDGRVAVIKKTISESASLLSIPFQVSDSLCSDTRGQQCFYKTPYRSIYYFAVWLKHPDQTKIDQPLMSSQDKINPKPDDQRRIEERTQILGAETQILPKMSSGLLKPEITCDDFSWLPSGTKDAPDTLLGKRWDSELMAPNSETGANENRVVTTVINVLWEKTEPQVLRLKSIGGIANAFGGLTAILVFNDVTTATLEDKKGGLCSVELKPGSFADVIKQVGQIDAARTSPALEKHVYIAGEDENSIQSTALKSAVNQVSRLIENITNMSSGGGVE
jgi:hypothetical protein